MRNVGLGITLAVIGAILAFAISDNFGGVDLTMIGYILMAGGALLALIGLIFHSRGTKTTTVAERQTPEGTVVDRKESASNMPPAEL